MLTCVLLGALLAGAPSPETVRRAAREVLADPEIQGSLPSRAAAAEEPEVRDLTPPAAPGGVPGAMQALARVALWVLIAVSAALVAVFGARQLSGYSGDVPRKAEDVLRAAVHLPSLRPLRDADALARQGRFTEAVHMLLIRAIDELVERLGVPVDATSREILARAPLAAPARAALSVLVRDTEVSTFGGAEAGPREYARCVESYARFRAASGTDAAG